MVAVVAVRYGEGMSAVYMLGYACLETSARYIGDDRYLTFFFRISWAQNQDPSAMLFRYFVPNLELNHKLGWA